MNKIINKIKKLSIKSKIIYLSIILVFVIGISIIFLGRTYGDLESANIPNKIVDGLSFENASIEYSNGMSVFTAYVYNENKTTYNLKYINVKLTDENGMEIIMKGYIGNSLNTEQGRKLVVKINKDLTNSVSVDYEIIK